MRAILLLSAVVILAFPVRGDDVFDDHTRRGINLVYDLDFEGAEQEFGAMVRLKPSHPAGHFFLAMVEWWRILIDMENEGRDENFHRMLDGVIDLCDSMLDRNGGDVTALFFKGGAIGFKGRLDAHRSEWLAAANAGRKALPIVQEAYALDPGNNDILLGTGIYNYYAEIIPREYPFVKPLLLFVPPGDREKGLQQLTRAAEQGRYASVEATYFLMQLYFQFEKDYPRALLLAEDLHTRFPNNMLFHKYLGRCNVTLGNWARAAEIFEQIAARCARHQRGYAASTEREAAYYLGLHCLGQKQLDEALRYFYRCDELSRTLDRSDPSGFMVMANLRVGNIYDVQGKRELAMQQYRKVLDLKEYQSSHDAAEQYLKSPFHH